MVATAEMLSEIAELKNKRKNHTNKCESRARDITTLLDENEDLDVEDDFYDELLIEVKKAKELVKVKD